MIGGVNTDSWWDDPSPWKDTIQQYLGWSDDTWAKFYSAWTAQDANRQQVMDDYHIYFFNWNNCKCGNGGQNSTAASVETWALPELSRLLKGKTDVTLIGHSKGGNLLLNFLQKIDKYLPAGQELPRNVVLLDTPNWFYGPFTNIESTDRSVPISSINVVNFYNIMDPFNHAYSGAVAGADNYRYNWQAPSPWPPTFEEHWHIFYDQQLISTLVNSYLAVDRSVFVP